MKGKILDKALTLRLAFLIIPSRCSLKLSLLSTLMPSSFSQVLFSIFISLIFRFIQLSDLKIPNYNNCDPLAENIQEPVLKGIEKYRNHPSILTIGEAGKKNPHFFLGVLIKLKF